MRRCSNSMSHANFLGVSSSSFLRVGHFELILLLQPLHQAMQISDTYDGSHTDARQNRQHAGCTARLCRTKIATAFAPGRPDASGSSLRARWRSVRCKIKQKKSKLQKLMGMSMLLIIQKKILQKKL